MRRPKVDPFPGVMTKQKVNKYGRAWVLTEEQEAWLRRWFPVVENPVLMAVSGMSHSTLHRFARSLGLTKSEEGLRGIKHRQAMQVKRTCERNGYYDSIRGRAPSEACLEGSRRRWQAVRDGLADAPLTIIKRTQPRRYANMMKRQSEARRDLIRREKRRALYAMERKTSLHLPMNNYTKSQVSHRYNALKRGYILMTDCSDEGGERWNIYYDADTQRTAQFERNLAKDGFKVLPWQEEETNQ